MSITVDGQRYEYKGTVEASKGSGDNKEDLRFTVYTDPEGRECWLGEDKKRWYLYRDVTNAEARLKAGHTHEEFAADKLKILGETFSPAKFSWVTLNDRQMAEPGAFRGTDQAMRMGNFPKWPRSAYRASAPVTHNTTAPRMMKAVTG